MDTRKMRKVKGLGSFPKFLKLVQVINREFLYIKIKFLLLKILSMSVFLQCYCLVA